MANKSQPPESPILARALTGLDPRSLGFLATVDNLSSRYGRGIGNSAENSHRDGYFVDVLYLL